MPSNPRIVIPVICPVSLNEEKSLLAWDNLLYLIRSNPEEVNKTTSCTIKTAFMLQGGMNLSDLSSRDRKVCTKNVPYPEEFDDGTEQSKTIMFSWNGQFPITTTEKSRLETIILSIVRNLTGLNVALGLIPSRKKFEAEPSEE